MFNSWSIKAKLISICLLISAFGVVSGAISFYALREVSAKYSHVAQSNLPNTRALGGMTDHFRRIRIALRTLGLKGILPAQATAEIKIAKEQIEEFEKSNKAYLDIPFVPGEDELYKPVHSTWVNFKAVGKRVIDLAQSGSPDAERKMTEIFFKDCPEAAAAFNSAIMSLLDFQETEGKKWSAEAEATAQRANLTNIIVIFLGFFVSMILGFVFSRTLAKTLNELAHRLGKGADDVASASCQVAGASTELSAGATQQAASLQETVASLDEVSAMVNKNADNAQRSQELSGNSQQAAIKGKQVVNEMIQSIDAISASNQEIMQQIESSNREISDIVKVITEIGTKTKVINDIVFQTKLLSFNASVEAARAGEHGKGFAVVAEEVGNLAQMSGNAAKEISSMLEGSIKKVEGIVAQTKSRVERLVVSGKEKIDTGTATAQRCGQVLDEIVSHVSDVSQMVSEIATACSEQATGVREINKAMSQLDQVTQQNATASHDSASAAESLTSQSEELRGMVRSLAEAVEGAKAATTEGHSGGGSKPKRIAADQTGKSHAAQIQRDAA